MNISEMKQRGFNYMQIKEVVFKNDRLNDKKQYLEIDVKYKIAYLLYPTNTNCAQKYYGIAQHYLLTLNQGKHIAKVKERFKHSQ